MSKSLLLFGGTYEGRILAEYLSRQGMAAYVFTATEYGGELIMSLPHLVVRSERLTAPEMAEFIGQKSINTAIDATHPFAQQVTQNILEATKSTGVRYIRVVREESADCQEKGITYVENTEQAVDFLRHTQGTVLLTTGSKELAVFCQLPDFQERLYARVLPMPAVIEHCYALGLSGAHIIAMQGPFTEELNLALLRQFRCTYLVTKNTGTVGGMESKIAAALTAGAKIVVINRPEQEKGYSLSEIMALLDSKCL